MEVTAVIVLLDQDPVLGDGLQGDVAVSDALDEARFRAFRFDADACV